MKNTPGWVILVCATILFLVFGTFTFWLTYKGVDDTQFRGFVILISTLLNTLLTTGSFVAASASQRQTNGITQEGNKNADS